jgi:predicted acyl esterase
VRVQVFGSFSPNFSRNLQTGMSEVTSAKMKQARIRVYHGGARSSEIVLPVVVSP